MFLMGNNQFASNVEFLEQETMSLAQCRYLWRCVILQAFRDMKRSKFSKKDSRSIASDAKRWLLYDKDDFYTVCSYANFNPKTVRSAAQRIANQKENYNKRFYAG
jgi:hypothetical protein